LWNDGVVSRLGYPTVEAAHCRSANTSARTTLPPAEWLLERTDLGRSSRGISVALALSLPAGDARDVVVSLTYLVVIFSILIQGMSIGTLLKRVIPCAGPR
jgi:CPA1 family monovalent cation:H+ antiporter